VVLIITVLAGVYGLYEAPAFRSQPLITALLLALAAGMLALALVRVLAFLAGGMVGLLIVQSLFPNWGQPLIGFLICGLLGLALFRLWMMALTSLSGSVVMGYAILCLLNQTGRVNAISFSEGKYVLLNWLCGFVAVAGFGFQLWYNRGGGQKEKEKKGSSGGKEDDSAFWILPLWGLRRKAARKAG